MPYRCILYCCVLLHAVRTYTSPAEQFMKSEGSSVIAGMLGGVPRHLLDALERLTVLSAQATITQLHMRGARFTAPKTSLWHTTCTTDPAQFKQAHPPQPCQLQQGGQGSWFQGAGSAGVHHLLQLRAGRGERSGPCGRHPERVWAQGRAPEW